jgi:hypothetical protein
MCHDHHRVPSDKGLAVASVTGASLDSRSLSKNTGKRREGLISGRLVVTQLLDTCRECIAYALSFIGTWSVQLMKESHYIINNTRFDDSAVVNVVNR